MSVVKVGDYIYFKNTSFDDYTHVYMKAKLEKIVVSKEDINGINFIDEAVGVKMDGLRLTNIDVLTNEDTIKEIKDIYKKNKDNPEALLKEKVKNQYPAILFDQYKNIEEDK